MMAVQPFPTQTTQSILCCTCSTLIPPNAANMCLPCIKDTIDITEGITKQLTIHHCSGCNMYLQPPKNWIRAEMESRELLAVILKRLRGLNKVKLVDASFLWTEPHSKRLKVKLNIQKEVFAALTLQQTFTVDIIVAHQMCELCHQDNAQQTWKAAVQLRQKVTHKKTFLYLEQLILKFNAHRDSCEIAQAKDGMDFFFPQQTQARKFIDFLLTVAPIKFKLSEEIISADIHTSTANFKYSYSVTILPICKDDLVCLPLKVANSLSNIGQLVLCSKVNTSLLMLNPRTLVTSELSPTVYWRSNFPALLSTPQLSVYTVLDVDLLPLRSKKHQSADVTVVLSNGDWSKSHVVRTHLGGILKVDDEVLGYNLEGRNFPAGALMNLDESELADVVLVKKLTRRRNRHWKLRRMKMQQMEDTRSMADEKDGNDYEAFLQDIEEDPEFRKNMNLYRDKEHPVPESQEHGDASIGLDELLDDLTLEDEVEMS